MKGSRSASVGRLLVPWSCDAHSFLATSIDRRFSAQPLMDITVRAGKKCGIATVKMTRINRMARSRVFIDITTSEDNEHNECQKQASRRSAAPRLPKKFVLIRV